ncbi:dual specificity mitogen-activated protein kinase kinase 1 [Stagonosporopsis vannaccii]|nr:dual specificity mitogen-activated protein kinase kinase 1 [Stagonosporopsis vannaccii]
MGSARRVAEESIDHLIPSPPFDKYLDERIVTLIRKHLKRHEFFRPWWDSPRLYALLRMLRCDEDAVSRFQNASINDFWLPIDESTFNAVGTSVDWDDFRRMQRHVLTNHELMSEAELLATPDVHRHLEYDDYFEEGKHLGEGTSARVFQVQHVSLDNRKGGFYACKRATRGKGKLQRERIQLFIKELQILRRIKHPHTVRLVTSYTDTSHFALVLSPVADESLKEMLEAAMVPLPNIAKMLLLQSFACLVSALSYLHSEGIRHKDIKPSNIVLSKGRVYLCDFGVSNDWTGSDPITEGPTHLTPGYCAPEVSNYEQRTDAQDVWSMGRVFCEIFTVVAGRTLDDLLQRIGGDLRSIYKEEGLTALKSWISELDIDEAALASTFLRQIILRMMATESAIRPKSRQLVTELGMHWAYIGECCQEVYGRTSMSLPTRPLSEYSSTQRSSHGFPRHAMTYGSSQQLAVPSNPLSNDIRSSPQRMPDQDIGQEGSASDFPSSILLDRQSSIVDHRTSVGYSSTDWSSGSAISPHQTPRISSVSHTDRRTSFGASSTQSHQRVRWSSGPVQSVQPNAVNSSVACSCAPRRNSHRLQERLVLSSTDVELFINTEQPTIEITDCGLCQNVLHVYESYSRQSNDKYRVWLKTRRLVVSQGCDATAKAQCYSFWLPLTDIASAVEENRLTLKWSDCNQWRTSPLRNNKQTCDCVYNPENLNNEITISFPDPEAAVAFLNNLCAVYSDCDGVKEWRNVEIIDHQRLLAVDVQDQAKVAYRIACLATYKSALYSTFQVFIHWPDLDLDIRVESSHANSQHSMVIRFDQVSTPNYTSDVANEPWVDKSKVARCIASNLVLGTYSMAFPYEPGSASRIPDGVKQTLEYLTGWTLCFFAADVQLAKDKLIWDTNYGASDVMVWTRRRAAHDNDDAATQPDVKMTFRHRRARPNYIWRSASVDPSARLSFSLTTAEFPVTHKSHGDKLHTPSMSAGDGPGSASSASDKATKLGLRFATSHDLTALVGVLDELQKRGRRDSLTKVPTNSTLARVSRDLFRRHSNAGA